MAQEEGLMEFNFFETLEQYANFIMSAYTNGMMLANCVWTKILDSEYSEFTNQIFAVMTYVPSLIIGFQCFKRVISVTWLRKSRKIEELQRLEIQLGVVRERVSLAQQSTASRTVRLRAAATRLAVLRARVHAGLREQPCLHLHRHHLDAWEARFQRDLFMEDEPDRDIMISASSIFDYNNPLGEVYSLDSEQSSQQSINLISNASANIYFLPPTDTESREISMATNYISPSEHSLSATYSGLTTKVSDNIPRRANSAVHIQIAALHNTYVSPVDQFFVDQNQNSTTIIDEWNIGSLPIITVDIKNKNSASAEQLNKKFKVQELVNYENDNSLHIPVDNPSIESLAAVVEKESSESMIQTYVNRLWKTKSDLDNAHESVNSEYVSSATNITGSPSALYGKPIKETIIDVMAKFYGFIDQNPIIEPSMVDNCFENYQKYFEKSYLEFYGKGNGHSIKTGDSLNMYEIDNGDVLPKETNDKNRGLFVVREETNSEVEVEEKLIENMSDEEWQNSDTFIAVSDNNSYGTLADFNIKYVGGDCAGDCAGAEDNASKLPQFKGLDNQHRTLGLTEICIKHFTDK